MAERRLDIIFSAQDRFTGVISGVNSSLDSVERRFKSTAESMVNLKTVSIAAAAALTAMGYELYKAIQAANEAEAAEKKLTTALGYTSKALLDQSAALQKLTVFGDDQIQGVMASIAAFTRDEGTIKALTKATLDFASAKGMDLASAGDLVGKSFGSSTNALARYGVQSDAAAGSTEKLLQITEGITALYGGQAEATANTFGGRISQLKNAFGDLQEEIGFVITKNSFFTKSVDLLRQIIERATQWVQNHRLALMELVKGGMIRVVESIGYAVEAVRFFHNGWLGLKLAGQAVSLALVDSINWIYKALRFVLLPLDLMYQGMVKLGLVKVNPFNAAQKAISEYREAVLSVGADVLSEIEKANFGYDRVRNSIKGIVYEMKGWKAEQTGLSDTTPRPDYSPPPGSRAKEELDRGREQASRQLAGLGAAPEVLGPGAPEQFSEAAQMEQRLQQIRDFHVKKLLLMEAAGRSEADITAAFNQAQLDMDRQTHQLRLSQAQGAFGMMANMMQNLTVLTGKQGGTAFKAMKAFAIAETTIQTYKAAQGAYAALAPIPVVGPALAVAAAAAAIVAGLARVKQIASMEPGGTATGSTISAGGTANSSYSGGSSSAYPAPTRQEESRPAQQITVNVYSPLGTEDWDRVAEESIIPAISRAVDRQVTVRVSK